MTTTPETVHAIVGVRENSPAIDVRDRTLWHNDPRTRDLIADLGDEVAESIYEHAAESFWDYTAPELAREHGYSGKVYSAGRSAGWLYLGDRLDFLELVDLDAPSPDDLPAALARAELLAAQSDTYGEADFERETLEALTARDRWLAFARALTVAVEHHGDEYAYLLQEAHDELEARLEACVVKADN